MLLRTRRNWGARLRVVTEAGIEALVLENRAIRATILVGRGADLVELCHKPTDTDVAWLSSKSWQAPGAYWPTGPDAAGAFLDDYPGGWQEVFPNGGAPSTLLGAPLGQHGEVSLLPWEWEALEDGDDGVVVRMAVRCRRSPFRLERTVRIDATSPRLQYASVATNEGAVRAPAMWGHHLTFGRPFFGPGGRVELPGDPTVTTHEPPLASERRITSGTFRWSEARAPSGERVDLARVPPSGPSELVYLSDLAEGLYTVWNEGDRLGVQARWDLAAMPYLWFWQELGAPGGYPWFGRHWNIGLEPFSSFPTTGVQAAVENGTALWFAPGEARRSALEVSIVQGGGGA